MNRPQGNSGLAPYLLLALLLLAAQTAALGHNYEHAVGTPQTQVCAACVTANLLASACIDAPGPVIAPIASSAIARSLLATSQAVDVPAVRQRGPPVTL